MILPDRPGDVTEFSSMSSYGQSKSYNNITIMRELSNRVDESQTFINHL